MKDLIQKYQRSNNLMKRRSILSQIAEEFGRDKAAQVCKLVDVAWLSWYYYEIPKRMKKKEIRGNMKNMVLGEVGC